MDYFKIFENNNKCNFGKFLIVFKVRTTEKKLNPIVIFSPPRFLGETNFILKMSSLFYWLC